jgi:hypothetical protein
MPYIKDENSRRKELVLGVPAQTAGELNYQIFQYIKYNLSVNLDIIRQYMRKFVGKTPNYQRYNDLSGCIICCYREVYRRLNLDASYLFDLLDEYNKEIDNYEDKKRDENGEV